MANVEMKDIVELSKIRGFVYPGSEIYGGLANSWDYGPLGSLLKENIKNAWIKNFVQRRSDMVLFDSSVLLNSQVWITSGHVGWFSDPLIDDKLTKERFRADKLLEACIESKEKELGKNAVNDYFVSKYAVKNLVPESWPLEIQGRVMREEEVKNPNTGEKADWTEVRKFNLMFTTKQGVTDDSTSTIYLRPETAQGIFINFANVVRSSRKKVPFGIAQVGKAFRNEITPGNFIFRTRELEMMEIEFFCEPGTDKEWHEIWKKECMRFLTEDLGIKAELLRIRDHEKEELSHYSAGTADIEYKFPFGWGELWGIANRTDFDLSAHMKDSKADLSYVSQTQEGDQTVTKKYIPYVIEPALGLTRMLLVTMLNAYTRVETEEGSRVIMKFKPSIAPIKVAILPVVKKLSTEAMSVFNLLSPYFTCEYDDAGAIGKRYYRMDEIGVPFSIAIDSDNYNMEQVTVRHRDTWAQETVKISELRRYIEEKIETMA